MNARLPFAEQDALERRFDGPVPPADPLRSPSSAGRARLFERLCAETALATGMRRAAMPAAVAATDGRLEAFRRRLGSYRQQGRAWHEAGA